MSIVCVPSVASVLPLLLRGRLRGCLRGLLITLLGAAPLTFAESLQQTTATKDAEDIEAAGYAREMPPGAPMGAAYVTVRNFSGQSRVLERVELPSHPQGRVELHTTRQAQGVSQMRAVNNLTLPANGTIEMRPGAAHLMVHGVVLKAGDTLPLRLVFADGSSRALLLPVRGLGDKVPATSAAKSTIKSADQKDGHSEHHHHHSG